ncbi:hypothetical protein [Dictyobacter kobayashii]|uniref:Uncharacterized protein n=1 Tax=Dictyobacter kobayashii TaxID=2014872 RepID=A0A402AVT9_9CHLR|nr:hypothetical protein [Dictyobacter kobayashii]GCE23207.1 hypothetical protein KDK_70070 [Dictyobacter kobayashii]
MPQFVFANLARRWQEIAPPDLVGVVQYAGLERYLQEEGGIIADTAKQALVSYWDLTPIQQADLLQRFPSMDDILNLLQKLLNIDNNKPEQFTITDWLTWFERLYW